MPSPEEADHDLPSRARILRHDPESALVGGLEAVRIWLFGGFRVSVGSRSIGEEE